MDRYVIFPKMRDIRQYLPDIPIRHWLPKYKRHYFQQDFIAGLTVGMMVIPQGMAYAKSIANLPIQYGLYSSFMGLFVYSFLGTSKDLSVGPTSILSLIVAQNCAMNGKYIDIDDALFLSFFSGLIQLFMGLLHLGVVVDFISEPVITGFVSSAALTIGAGQLKHLFGLTITDNRQDFYHVISDVFSALDSYKTYDIIMGISCIVVLLLLQTLKSKFDKKQDTLWGHSMWFLATSRNAVVVIFASAIAYGVYESDSSPMSLVGTVPSGFPSIELPSFSGDRFSRLASNAVVIALVGFLEGISMAKSFSRQNGYEIVANQELVALGTANLVGSFFQAYPVTGSFSRSAVNASCFVRTLLGGIIAGAIVILAFETITGALFYIPQACLSAVVIVAVLFMIEIKTPIALWKTSKLEFIPYITCVVCILFLGVEIGMAIAVGVSILVALVSVARPQHRRIDVSSVDGMSLQLQTLAQDRVAVIQIGGKFGRFFVLDALEFVASMLFPAMNRLRDDIVRLQKQNNSRAVILDMSLVTLVDFTGITMLKHIAKDLEAMKVGVYATNVAREVEIEILKAKLEGQVLVYSSVAEAVKAASTQALTDPGEDTPLV